ncbi:MFS transporter [Kitasatospora sp. NPDC096147]|uniref:MFS transporter n=1 Tax=Kitasatospora sp. NPDC096147 TaxID=3364093 RepID=UPI003801A9E1
MERQGTGRPLAALAGAQFTVVLSTSVVNVALPQISAGAGLTEGGTAWVVNAYGLVFGALLLLGGRAADLLGPRRVLAAGLAVFAAASVAAGLADGPWLLIGSRAVQGAGAAAAAPAALALLVRLFPPGARRARALGLWGAVSGAGGAAGVLLGGVLTEAFGWRWIFHACALGAALVLGATLRSVPADPPRGTDRPPADLFGALTSATAVLALVYGLGAARGSGWTSPAVLGPLATAALLAVLFRHSQLRHPAPLLPPTLIRRGPVGPANLLMALLGAVWVGLFYFLPLLQQQVLGAGPLAAGLAQLPLAAANMAGAALAPRVTRALGPHGAPAAALLLQAAGLLWLALLAAPGTTLAALTAPTVLIGLGLGAAFVRLTGAAVDGVRPEHTGVAGGLVNTTRQLGGAVGLALLVSFASGAGTPAGTHRTAFLLAAALAATAAALTPLLARRTTTRTREGATP